jgi:hypothetical protein
MRLCIPLQTRQAVRTNLLPIKEPRIDENIKSTLILSYNRNKNQQWML